ncbi:MAG: hypothetical protein R3222_03185 [Balneolaceae bacterium]|nr:hypothetical protein [Balneolaceae bacterium]
MEIHRAIPYIVHQNKNQIPSVLKQFLKCCAVASCLIFLAIPQKASSQTIKLLAGNTLNGAVTGVSLGGAVMGLQNSDDFAPARVGVGAGTLFGIGVGFYDVSQVAKGEQFYISGTFNDGTNTSIIVLLDTFYGAAAGAIVASSITLIANKPIVDALQYGSSAGAWVGFGFGLIDAFALSKGPGDYTATASTSYKANAEGLLSYTSKKENFGIGLVNPSLTSVTTLKYDTYTKSTAFNLELLNVSLSF